MVTRYDVALWASEHWSNLMWKTNKHTEGIYFTSHYGYVIEKQFAMRFSITPTDAPDIFYYPTAEDIDAQTEVKYPYIQVTKEPHLSHVIAPQSMLRPREMERLFQLDAPLTYALSRNKLKEFLERVKVKRVRDKTWLVLREIDGRVLLSLWQQHQKQWQVIEEMTVFSEGVFPTAAPLLVVNANIVHEVLAFFSEGSTVFFSSSHDKIKLTTHQEADQQIEAMIGLAKPSIYRQLYSFFDMQEN